MGGCLGRVGGFDRRSVMCVSRAKVRNCVCERCTETVENGGICSGVPNGGCGEAGVMTKGYKSGVVSPLICSGVVSDGFFRG